MTSTALSCPAKHHATSLPGNTIKHRIAFAMLMGVITTGTISFALIAVNLGFSDRFLRLWLRSWALGYIVAIPAILVLGPLIQRFVDRLLKPAIPA